MSKLTLIGALVALHCILTKAAPTADQVMSLPDNGNTVYENVYSWNKVGHVIYLESPAGVGFSYSTDGNIVTDDDKTAKENYNALVNLK
uniref:Uncharacterized protein n=1 Tax=Acrobeloides nanus TaxID=290746 RepID=A0A914EC78_9BILA